MNKEAMYKLSYGLFVLTAKEGKKDNGCIINTAIQAASAPNQLSICINKANATHDMIVNTGKFTVSVLSQAADFELFKRFGFQSGRDVDKFEGYEACRRSENGIYYVTEGTNAYISAKVDHMVDLGSHTMFIGEPHRFRPQVHWPPDPQSRQLLIHKHAAKKGLSLVRQALFWGCSCFLSSGGRFLPSRSHRRQPWWTCGGKPAAPSCPGTRPAPP